MYVCGNVYMVVYLMYVLLLCVWLYGESVNINSIMSYFNSYLHDFIIVTDDVTILFSCL